MNVCKSIVRRGARGLRSRAAAYCSYSTGSASTFQLAAVPNRSIIEIAGRDTIKLLQGLISNNADILTQHAQRAQDSSYHDALYASFLHPNGRMLADTLLYGVQPAGSASSSTPVSDTVLIEVDSRAADSLLSFLKKFKLRSKVTLRMVPGDEWVVSQGWSPSSPPSSALTSPSEAAPPSSDLLQALEALASKQAHVRKDPRSAHLGYRVLVPGGVDVDSSIGSTLDSSAYLIHRLLQGIPEGHDDIHDASSLPLEANMDLNAGVDFNKGCYVGQELTARTHHTGVVRKRVVPVQFYEAGQSPPPTLEHDPNFESVPDPANADVRSTSSASSPTRRAKSAGKLLGSSMHNLGLGLLRLDQVERADRDVGEPEGARMKAVVTSAEGKEREVGVRAFIPASWDPQVVESVRLASP